MTEERVKVWTSLLVAALSLLGALRTELGARQQRTDDSWVVEVLAQQLAKSQEVCK